MRNVFNKGLTVSAKSIDRSSCVRSRAEVLTEPFMTDKLLKPFDAAAFAAATPIYPVREGQSIADCGAPDSLIALAAVNNFQGELGAVLAGEKGVLCGRGDGSDPFWAAAVCEQMPSGAFKIASDMTQQEASMTTLGWLLGGYKFTKYKSTTAKTTCLIAPENLDTAGVVRTAAAVALVRDLVNTPAGDMLPDNLEAAARALADAHDAHVTMTAGEALLENNFPMTHAVGRASTTPPRMIDIQWGRTDAPKVTLVGKGVCFDSGGLNIKGAGGMGLMKKDMGGAAHVLGLGALIMGSTIDVRLRILIPAVENAISGNAFRPGDVLPTRKGLTVEIGNTDAEGRLVLSDAITLAAEEDPALMITMATLTGAARVAVGSDLAPFYTDGEDLAAELATSANEALDPVWRMPLWKPYDAMLSSPIADMNNISGGSFAGSVTAALFLNRFVQDATRWIHFDIYAWRPKSAPGRPAGGEAQAIRALYAMIEKRFG